jgi:hypothetical protein
MRRPLPIFGSFTDADHQISNCESPVKWALFVLALLTAPTPFMLHPEQGKRIRFYNPTNASWEIRVTGDGMGDVDCYLYGRDGKFLESDTGTNDGCLLTTPKRMPGRYNVIVINEGNADGTYTVAVQ